MFSISEFQILSFKRNLDRYLFLAAMQGCQKLKLETRYPGLPFHTALLWLIHVEQNILL